MNFLGLYNIDIDDNNDIDLDLDDDDLIIRIPKRYIRDVQDPFDFYSEIEFKQRYRFDKDSVKFGILPLIEQNLCKVNKRGLPIPPIFQLLICLRFYATANFQFILGDTMTVSQPTVSRIVFRVSVLLASQIHDYIKMPRTQAAKLENQRLFERLGFGNGAIRIPGVDGAIGCTHIRLIHTRFQNINEIYRNRKGYFSLNVQTIVGPRMEFLDIVPEWPGSADDSRIFQNSRIYKRYSERELTGILVGDARYPCLPFLMTPIANPVTDEQIAYNNIQSRTRIIVERTYGVWKRRFPCLSRGLTTKLICSTTIVVACAVLHNLSLIFNDKLPDDDLQDNQNKEPNEEIPAPQPNLQPNEANIVL